MADFLDENNLCGQAVLKLVSRAHAIIAEILRLKDFIPSVFQSDQNKYHNVLSDFRYFKDQDGFEKKVNENDALVDLDEELRKNYLEILTRFYLAFESVHKYITDLNNFLSDIEDGLHIQQSLETVLLSDEGKQLMCEALYLYGIMLLVIDHHIDGSVRERILVSYYRYSAQRTYSDSKLDDVCQLLRSTGFQKNQPGKKPVNYPEDYFRRVSINSMFLDQIISHLRSDDIYHQITSHPLPEHRSTALAQQSAMLVICLYFTPEVLHNQTAKMREIVDKFFPDNWVTSVYMGLTVNLIEIWEPYRAARLALSNTIQSSNVKDCSAKHAVQIENLGKQLREVLKEGVLNEEFLLDNMPKLINLIRQSNVTLRWMLLHTNSLIPEAESLKKCRQIRLQVVTDSKYQPVSVFELLLLTAELELNVREMFRHLFTEKRATWERSKGNCVGRLSELADVFGGEKPLSRIEKNENLQKWLREIAQQVGSLNYEEGTASGRKMAQLIQALEEVQEFHQLDSQLQVKQFLNDTRCLLYYMIRIANLREDFLITLQIVSDLSYAWIIIDSYTEHMQRAIGADPALVGRLRATFLKLSSALDLPLMRINQARSADLLSVSQHYSTELVSYIRHVLHIIPQTMFGLVEKIVHLQTNVIKEIPVRLDKDKLKEYAQLDHRFQVAKLTESVSVLTDGILAMKTTLVGIVQLDPKQLLEEGIRRELVRRVANAMHTQLTFDSKSRPSSELTSKLTSLGEIMEGLRKSFEYIQDYVRIQGLRMFHEETARIVGYYVEQECNSHFQSNHVQDWQSRFQSTAVPIPKPMSTDSRSVTVIGQLAHEILRITDPKVTVFVPFSNTWYDQKSQSEMANLLLFSNLESALGTSGLAGLDTLFSFMAATELTNLFNELHKEVFRNQDLLESLAEFNHLTTPSATTIIGQPSKTYGSYINRFCKYFPALLEHILKLGQLQLLRKCCSNQLKSSASFDSSLLYSALQTLNLSIVNDLAHQDKNSAIVSTSLFPEMTQYLQWSGLYDPLRKVYTSTRKYELPYIAHFLLIFILSQLNKLAYNKKIDSLVAKRLQDNIDGIPFVIGLATLLHHLGSATTETCCGLLIQFVRSNLELNFNSKSSQSTGEISNESGLSLALMEHWRKCGLITQSFMYSLLNEGVWSLYKISML